MALIAAAIETNEAEVAVERASFYAFARRGRPQGRQLRRTIDLRHGGHTYRFAIQELGPRRFRVDVDGVSTEVEVEHVDAYERRIVHRGRSHRAVISVQGAQLLVEVDGVLHRPRDDGGFVRSLAPGVVVSTPSRPATR